MLAILGYDSENQAIEIAYDSEFCLAGQVINNQVGRNSETPFGGCRQSGKGPEKVKWSLFVFLELIAITGVMSK